MSDKMMKMMMGKKKEGKSLSDSEKKSKLEALMGMRGLADSHMGNKLKNLKKVTVASNSPEGLKAGLHKAEDMAEDSDDMASKMEDSDMHGEMNKFSKGGEVESDEDHGHVMHMPEGFDTDGDQAMKEAHEMAGNDEEHPDGMAEGGEADEEQPESVEDIAQDAEHLDSEELDELIRMLQEKKASK